jgi:cell wall-associated NlpC family hydrolase
MSHAHVGFRVAGGDACAMADAARRYEIVGQGLEAIGVKVRATEAALAGRWQGEAATSYHDTSSKVDASLHAAARAAATTSAALRRYSAELERCQREGIVSRHQAERCLAEIETETRLLSAAESDAKTAQTQLTAARRDGAVARGAGGPVGNTCAAAADQRAASAQVALTDAQNRERSAREKLRQSREELAHWQAKGRRAEEEAHAAAHRTAGALRAQTVTPPVVLAAAGTAPSAYLAAPAPGPAVPAQAGPLAGAGPRVNAPIGHSARARVEAMVRFADSVLGLPYVWGGGHGGWGPQPGYDCSGFVSAVLHAGGYLSQPADTSALVGQPGILTGPGHVVTIYDRALPSTSGHVMISINGQFYESGGESGPWGGGGGVAKIGTPSATYLASFPNVLHPQGL